MKQIAQQYLQKESNFPAYDPAAKEGKWKTVMVRTNQRGHVMCVMDFNPETTPQVSFNVMSMSLNYYIQTHSRNLEKHFSVILLVLSIVHINIVAICTVHVFIIVLDALFSSS